jgi:hypothetical protein
MQPFLFELGHQHSPTKRGPLQTVRSWLKDEFVIHKLNTPIGYLFMVLLGLLISWQIGHFGWESAQTLFTSIVLIPSLILATFHTRYGLYLMLAFSFCLATIERIGHYLPLEVFLDLGIWGLLFGMMVRESFQAKRTFRFHGLSFLILLWTAYCLFEWINPWSPSGWAWLYAVREVGEYPLIFFAGIYGLRNLSHIRSLLAIWLVLATLTAIFAIFQAWIGYTEFDWAWLLKDYSNFESVYTYDRLRTFSWLADPATLGILMGQSSLLGLVLLVKSKMPHWQRALLGLGIIFMLLAMILSGTRTAIVMVPAGFLFLMLVSMDRNIWLTALVLGTVFSLSMWLLPQENPHLKRIRSAFLPQQAVSFQIRMENHEYVQPFILSHPIGGGIGSTSKWGKKFAPYTMLSQFPPDSGYVRIAVEMGWVGLALYLLLIFGTIATGVKAYFRSKGSPQQWYVLAFLGVLFSLSIANYPQQALTQHPNALMFFIAAACVLVLKRLAESATPLKEPAENSRS